MHYTTKEAFEHNNAKVIINFQTEEYEVPGHLNKTPIFKRVEYTLESGEVKDVLRFRETGDCGGFGAIEKEGDELFSRNFLYGKDRKTLRMISNHKINQKELRARINDMVGVRFFGVGW